MANEQNELAVLRQRLESFGVTGYTIERKVVYWRGQSLGNIDYLVSRRDDQLKNILDLFKRLGEK